MLAAECEKAAAMANIWLSRKGKALNQEASLPLLPAPFLLPPLLVINGCTAATMTFYTVSSPSHHASGDTLAFGGGACF